MIHSPDILAARYALGVADESEIKTAEALLETDPSFAGLVAQYQIIFDDLHQDTQPVLPPAGMWDRIEAAIASDQGEPKPRTVSPKDIAWQPIAPNLEQKILYENVQDGIRMVLYRAGPGAIVERHRNHVSEECLVLEGEIEIEGTPLKAGDMQIIMANTMHGPIVSRNSAIIYIRESGIAA